MADLAILAVDLGKRYSIGAQRAAPYKTLRDILSGTIASLSRRRQETRAARSASAYFTSTKGRKPRE